MRAPLTLGLIAGLAAACACHAADAACPDRNSVELKVHGASLCVEFAAPADGIRRQLLRDWTLRSAQIVANYYAEFPAPLVVLEIQSVPGGGVRGGRTTNESGLLIQVNVGVAATAQELSQDWVLVHEMVHLALPELAAGLEDSFGGGGYTAKQRAALLQLASDHVSSALDGRESAFELHASGGMPNWRGWLRQNFRDYNELANAVLGAIDLAMPEIDVGGIPTAPIARRRPVAPAGSGGN